MKVWITKYALTTGIFEAEAERCEGGRMVKIVEKVEGVGHPGYYVHAPDWHPTEIEAINHALGMARRKIVSLDKSKAAMLEKIDLLRDRARTFA